MVLASLWKLRTGKACPTPGSTLTVKWKDGPGSMLVHGGEPEGPLPSLSPPLGFSPTTNIDTAPVQPTTERVRIQHHDHPGLGRAIHGADPRNHADARQDGVSPRPVRQLNTHPGPPPEAKETTRRQPAPPDRYKDRHSGTRYIPEFGNRQQGVGTDCRDPVAEEQGDSRQGGKAHKLGRALPDGTHRASTGKSEIGRKMVEVLRV
ncbi:hypothetical protein BDZ91DRAFT_784573 [Kalaharituber pfeilii]|nr:hypothetical protein BDZ91DRAFT_784573 [Kalaharituber pfeilii]